MQWQHNFFAVCCNINLRLVVCIPGELQNGSKWNSTTVLTHCWGCAFAMFLYVNRYGYVLYISFHLTPWQSQRGTNDIEVGQKHIADDISVRIHFWLAQDMHCICMPVPNIQPPSIVFMAFTSVRITVTERSKKSDFLNKKIHWKPRLSVLKCFSFLSRDGVVGSLQKGCYHLSQDFR